MEQRRKMNDCNLLIKKSRAKTWVTWVTWEEFEETTDKGQKFSQRGKGMRVCKEERREWGLVIQRDWVRGQPHAIPHHKIFQGRKLAEWCVKLGRQIIVSTLFEKRYLGPPQNSVNNSMYRLHHFFNFSLPSWQRRVLMPLESWLPDPACLHHHYIIL